MGPVCLSDCLSVCPKFSNFSKREFSRISWLIQPSLYFLIHFSKRLPQGLCINVFRFKGVLLMNTNKSHLIKVFLVSSEVGQILQAICRSVPFS